MVSTNFLNNQPPSFQGQKPGPHSPYSANDDYGPTFFLLLSRIITLCICIQRQSSACRHMCPFCSIYLYAPLNCVPPLSSSSSQVSSSRQSFAALWHSPWSSSKTTKDLYADNSIHAGPPKYGSRRRQGCASCGTWLVPKLQRDNLAMVA